jgi:hypothetical protein
MHATGEVEQAAVGAVNEDGQHRGVCTRREAGCGSRPFAVDPRAIVSSQVRHFTSRKHCECAARGDPSQRRARRGGVLSPGGRLSEQIHEERRTTHLWNSREQRVTEQLHIRARAGDDCCERQAVDAAQRMVGDDDERSVRWNPLRVLVGHADGDLESLEGPVPERAPVDRHRAVQPIEGGQREQAVDDRSERREYRARGRSLEPPAHAERLGVNGGADGGRVGHWPFSERSTGLDARSAVEVSIGDQGSGIGDRCNSGHPSTIQAGV